MLTTDSLGSTVVIHLRFLYPISLANFGVRLKLMWLFARSCFFPCHGRRSQHLNGALCFLLHKTFAELIFLNFLNHAWFTVLLACWQIAMLYCSCQLLINVINFQKLQECVSHGRVDTNKTGAYSLKHCATALLMGATNVIIADRIMATTTTDRSNFEQKWSLWTLGQFEISAFLPHNILNTNMCKICV